MFCNLTLYIEHHGTLWKTMEHYMIWYRNTMMFITYIIVIFPYYYVILLLYNTFYY